MLLVKLPGGFLMLSVQPVELVLVALLRLVGKVVVFTLQRFALTLQLVDFLRDKIATQLHSGR